MNLEPAPRLNKTPFILTAAGCFAVMLLIGLLAPNRFATVPLIIAVVFLILSITAFMIPIILDYAADSAEYVQQEREKTAEQVQRLHAAGESLARAAAQIKAVEEAVHKTAHAAENLPYRMQEKLAEFNAALAEKEEANQESLEQELTELRAANSDKLKAAADKIAAATTEWTALESATRKQLKAAQDLVSQLDEKLKDTLAKLQAAPAPAEEKKPEPAVVVESVSVTETPAPVEAEPKPRKPRAPRKPKPEDTLAAMSESSEPAVESSEAPAAEAASEPSPAEASVSVDGATRLLVTAYIGIGNKLYIRGDGPGLSEDKGVPMHFVSIGKWGWSTNDATGPIACKLYKNDEVAAVSGEVFLEPGQHVEVTALF